MEIGFWDMFCNKRICETGPSSELAAFDGSKKGGRHWTEDSSVEEIC